MDLKNSLFAASAGLFFAASAASEFSRGLLQPTVRFGRNRVASATLEFQPSLRDGICLYAFRGLKQPTAKFR